MDGMTAWRGSIRRGVGLGLGLLTIAAGAGGAQEPAPAPVPVETGAAPVRVEITGVEGPLAQNVRALLRIAREEEAKAELSSSRVRQLDGQAEGEIRLALQPFGFYKPVIRRALGREGGRWLARYAIDAGPPTIVRRVDVRIGGEGARDSAFIDAVAEFPLAPGDTLQHLPYDLAKLKLIAIAADSGYLRAGFDTSTIVVDRAADTAAVIIRFDTGPRFRFGEVAFRQDVLDEGFLATRIPFERGEPYRQDKLLELQSNLGEDPYFAAVEVIPRPEFAGGPDGRQVPIEVQLSARKPRSYEGGLGYGTDTGPRGRLAGRWRRLNRNGHYAEAELTASLIEQSITTRYAIPAFGHPTGALTFVAGYAIRNPDSAQSSRSWLVGPRLSRRRLGWRETFNLQYQREAFEVGVDSGTTNLLTGGASWERTRSDSRIFPSSGLRLRLDLVGGSKQVYSSVTFGQVLVHVKAIRSLGPRARVLARVELGRMFVGEGVFRTLPPTYRFFAGGDQSVRGFRYQDLGPTDVLGNVVGGPNLLTGSLEADYRLLERWAVAAFTDAGNASNGFAGAIEQSVGAGIRWISPIGLVRVDGAIPVSEPGAPFRIHFSIGPDL